MSEKNPKQRRRGGSRDNSDLTIDLNRRELAELLERIRIKYERMQQRAENSARWR